MTIAEKTEQRNRRQSREITRELKKMTPAEIVLAAGEYVKKIDPKYRGEMLKLSVLRLAENHLRSRRIYGF
jgi:hypothetical protein